MLSHPYLQLEIPSLKRENRKSGYQTMPLTRSRKKVNSALFTIVSFGLYYNINLILRMWHYFRKSSERLQKAPCTFFFLLLLSRSPLPWVPEDIFFWSIFRALTRRKAPRRKKKIFFSSALCVSAASPRNIDQKKISSGTQGRSPYVKPVTLASVDAGLWVGSRISQKPGALFFFQF